MSPEDVQWWSLVIGLGVFGAIVLLLFAWRRLRKRAGGAPARSGAASPAIRQPGTAPDDHERPKGGSSPRRRPSSPPTPGSPGEFGSAVRSSILRAAAERVPAGWTALILSPPPHADRMTWHVHLAPEVALDLRDGRTVPVAAPAPSHDWQLSGGRVVGVGDGDPDPSPGKETVAIRVTGPYLIVSLDLTRGPDEAGGPTLLARVVLASGDDLPQPRAAPTDVRAVRAALREAIELAVGSRMTGAPPAVGYPPVSWAAHERIWLTVGS